MFYISGQPNVDEECTGTLKRESSRDRVNALSSKNDGVERDEETRGVFGIVRLWDLSENRLD